ncbi:PAS domain-containing protein [Jannaschia sp. Os4]|uniref:PAS domain-containing protein n=1 Tax=Jannaschia sp. Os4 TaxID=2807617 RepID=UPI00193956D1|nr:PAS domain-containing protein [Jannaschia sp. Os4]MBM2577369.1 PAS domain-containing protein [Jannaschia sp. Os4]
MTLPDDEDRLRPTAQSDLELDPRADDASENADPGALRLAAGRLYEQSLEQTRMAVVLSDPHQPDSPIIYCNRAFTELTGYDRDEVLGRNCRFLQGPETDPAAVAKVRAAIAAEEVRVVEMLNYRRDGSTFWNSLHVGPVYDEAGRLTHYYGSQWDVTEEVSERARSILQAQVAEELQHRTGNLFAVIGSILRVTARNEDDIGTFVAKVEGRLHAMDRAHRISIEEAREGAERADLHELVSTILEPYRTARADRVRLTGDPVGVPRGSVTPLGLMLHELATNAQKYGAFSTGEGRVAIAWEREGDDLLLRWIETGGPRVAPPERVGTGSRITEGVLGAIGASLAYGWPPEGLQATLRMPISEERAADA